MKDEIRALADRYAAELKSSIDERVAEMEQDDRSHVLIYQVLGVSEKEGKQIDVYQNKGRLLYNAAGRFLQEAAMLCFVRKFPRAGKANVPNTHGKRPKTFEIDRDKLSRRKGRAGNQMARCDHRRRPYHQGAHADAGCA